MRMRKMIVLGILLFLATATGRAAEMAEVDNPYGDESLIAQPRASSQHDRVTVVVNVNTEARHEASTDTSKETTFKWTLANLFRIGKDRDGDIIAKPFADARKPELDVSSEREHQGEGETEQINRTKAEISGEVIEVLPNGHLVVEARRSITVNEDEQVVLFTGRVDPRDLSAENSVDLKYVMEPSLKFLGKGGAVAASNRRGWLAKAFDKLSPF